MKITNASFILLFTFFASCSEDKKVNDGDTMSSGKSVVFVEEAFKPIIEEQLDVFSAINPKAELAANYSDENSIVANLLKAGSKTVIISRTLTEKEKAVLKSKSFTPEIVRFAVDAIAIIANKSVKDTAVTIGYLKGLMSGKLSDKNIVFDNPNSGTVRFLKNLSGSDLKAKNVYALKSNNEVIKYVSENSNCIGIIGFNWLNTNNDESSKFLDKIRMLAVQGVDTTAYFKPSQTTLALKQYPLSTGIYIINASGRLGLGAGFANFLISERGQRILLKSELLPEQIPTREIIIKN